MSFFRVLGRMGFEFFIFASMDSYFLNEDPSLDYFRTPSSNVRRSIVRNKVIEALERPSLCQNLKPLRLRYNQVCELLNITRDCLRKIIENDLSFPKPMKHGASRQAAVYFDTEEIEEWYRNYKLKCRGER